MTQRLATKTPYGTGMTALFAKYSKPVPHKKLTAAAAQALLDFDRPAKVFTFGNDTIIVLGNPSNSEAHYLETYLLGRMD